MMIRWLSRQEVAAQLSVHTRTIDRAIKSGELTAYKLGGIRIKESDVAAWAESKKIIVRRAGRPRLPVHLSVRV